MKAHSNKMKQCRSTCCWGGKKEREGILKEKEEKRVKKPEKGLRPYGKRTARETIENVHNVYIFSGRI